MRCIVPTRRPLGPKFLLRCQNCRSLDAQLTEGSTEYFQMSIINNNTKAIVHKCVCLYQHGAICNGYNLNINEFTKAELNRSAYAERGSAILQSCWAERAQGNDLPSGNMFKLTSENVRLKCKRSIPKYFSGFLNFKNLYGIRSLSFF